MSARVKVDAMKRRFGVLVAALAMVVAFGLPAMALADEPLVADTGDGLHADAGAETVTQDDGQPAMEAMAISLKAGDSLEGYYKSALQGAKSGSKYTLHDIDNNGVPELLIYPYVGTANKDNLQVYTVNSNGLTYCGATSGVYAYGICGSGNGTLYLSRAHNSSFSYYKVALSNGSVTTTRAFSGSNSGSGMDAFLANNAEAKAFASKNGIMNLELSNLNNYSLLKRYGVVHRSSGAQVMWRLYNPNSGEHFYTANSNERDTIAAVGWNFESMGWVAPTSSKTPVYRVYNPYAGEHHYTTSAAERNGLVRAGWNDEGIGWYSDDSKKVPVYREYNPNQFACNHNYTTNKSEHDQLVKLGWKNEGIAWYAMKSADGSSSSSSGTAIIDGWWQSGGMSGMYYNHIVNGVSYNYQRDLNDSTKFTYTGSSAVTVKPFSSSDYPGVKGGESYSHAVTYNGSLYCLRSGEDLLDYWGTSDGSYIMYSGSSSRVKISNVPSQLKTLAAKSEK